MTVAGYVHLNPVRAAMVDAPEDSRWTGYGAGCKGDALAQDGLRGLVSRACRAEDSTWEQARKACCDAIAGKIQDRVGVSSQAEPGSDEAPDPADDVVETDDKGRPIRAGSLRALLRRQSAGFLHGGALGSAAFLKRVAGALPERLRRKAEALFDRCPFLALSAAAGVRETPRSA